MPNRLAQETSPYLLQHSENPVDWYPWGPEALTRARAEDKPILLSIGYSACHWCHVMEHECFENAEIARLMNEHFVNIKVDREERPDLDQVYQNVAQAMTQGGGWPLTVFLTPDLKPFYGGTYFPPEEKHGRPAFPRLLLALSEAYRDNRGSVAENAEKLLAYIDALCAKTGSARGLPDLASLTLLGTRIAGAVDWENGGLGSAPKFPNTTVFQFLWRLGDAIEYGRIGGVPGSAPLPDPTEIRDSAVHSLSKMAMGGVYDQLGGGFHRYSVDATWTVPHFEKMLYDNALLLKAYAEVLLAAGTRIESCERELFEDTLEETVGYLLREMRSPEGGFYAAQDADSEGEEGKFFVWNENSIRAALPESEAKAILLRFGVTGRGNFEDGQSVLHVARPLAEVAEAIGVSEKDCSVLVSSGRKSLLRLRTGRVAPARDDKVLTAWNGLVISGLAWASRALSECGRVDAAVAAWQGAMGAYELVCTRLQSGDYRLKSSFQGGQAKLNAYLDDYAFMALAALDLGRFTPKPDEASRLAEQAARWIDVVLARFRDPAGDGYFFTSDDHERLIHRPKSTHDQAIPSGTAVTLECLAALSELGISPRAADYARECEEQLARLYPLAEKSPTAWGELLSAALLWTTGPIVLAGPAEQANRLPLHAQVFRKDAERLTVCQKQACHPASPDVLARLRRE